MGMGPLSSVLLLEPLSRGAAATATGQSGDILGKSLGLGFPMCKLKALDHLPEVISVSNILRLSGLL